MSKKVVAIDFGSRKLKIVTGVQKKSGMQIQHYDYVTLPANAYTEQDALNVDVFEALLKPYVRSKRLTSRDLYATFSTRRTIVRVRELPRVTPQEMDELIRFEAEQYLPYDTSGFYLDYRVIGEVSAEENAQFKVMVVAIPKEIIDSFMVLVKRLKLKLVRNTVLTDSVQSFAEKYLLKDELNTMIIDMGFQNANMMVFKGREYFASIQSDKGVAYFIDQLSKIITDPKDAEAFLFGELSEEALGRYLKADDIAKETPEEAMNLGNLRTLEQQNANLYESIMGIKHEDQSVEQIYESCVSHLMTDVNRMIDYFTTRRFETSIDHIYVIGGGEGMKRIRASFEEQYGAVVQRIKLSKVTPEDSVKILNAIGAIIGGGV